MQRFLYHTWALIVLVGLVYVLNRPWGTIPAIGNLFSPFHGFLQQIEGKPDKDRRALQDIDGLLADVQVKYDDRGVPHIFAQNDQDLYRAQGFIVAKDRLWQMDFYTRAASGRLTEIVGAAALDLDRYHRRIGMAKTAAEITEHLRKNDSLAYGILTAYAEGVNAFVNSLDKRSWPIEYKLLGYSPERWSPYKSILMLMNMRRDLSGGTDDMKMSQVLAKLGAELTAKLYPNYPFKESPIVPSGTLWDFDAVAIPSKPVDSSRITDRMNRDAALLDFPSPSPEIGSNNWAIHGSRTATGLPLLANDPHLTLSLPSIWYQLQLQTPSMNAYGVSIPGTPAIIIGFNKDVAWGVTNVGSDVMDFYQIRFADEKKETYLHEGEWKAVEKRIEIFKVKGAEDVVDTVFFTHHGPVVYHDDNPGNRSDFPTGHAMRWTGNLSESSDLTTFHLLNRAKNYQDYRAALRHFAAPPQNFVFADNSNNIAITSNGKFPLKWKEQGKFLLDGSRKDHEWAGWIPWEHNPHSFNPVRGFVSSANQFPVDTTYAYYLGWEFAAPNRGIRINERLSQMDSTTVDDFMALLHDNYNIEAEWLLPNLLADLSLSPEIANRAEFHALRDWDYQNSPESVGASIFERFIPALSSAIWDDELVGVAPSRKPLLTRTIQLLLEEPDAEWFDDRSTTDTVETKADIVQAVFLGIINQLEKEYGSFRSQTTAGDAVNPWAWGNVKNTSINHLVPNFAQFSRKGVYTGGGPRIVNATSKTHGPSWRMIVQLDAEWPKAWGLFPGGQSGNPGSPHYDDMIDPWALGQLDELLFLKDADQSHSRLRNTLKLRPLKP